MRSRVDLVKNKVVDGDGELEKMEKNRVKKMKTFFIRVSTTYFLLGDSGVVLGSLVLRFLSLSTPRTFLFIIIIITSTLSSTMFQISTRS